MRSLLALCLAAALPLGAFGQASPAPADAVLRARLERFKRLSPEQKQRLRERLEHFRRLPEEERARLVENLRRFRQLTAADQLQIRQKVERLDPAEKKAFIDLSSGFFRWAHRQGYLDGFPREVFFAWLKQNRDGELARLREMEPADRKDAFIRLYFDFKLASLRRLREHSRVHACLTDPRLEELRQLGPREFWKELQETWRACRERARAEKQERGLRKPSVPLPPPHR